MITGEVAAPKIIITVLTETPAERSNRLVAEKVKQKRLDEQNRVEKEIQDQAAAEKKRLDDITKKLAESKKKQDDRNAENAIKNVKEDAQRVKALNDALAVVNKPNSYSQKQINNAKTTIQNDTTRKANEAAKDSLPHGEYLANLVPMYNGKLPTNDAGEFLDNKHAWSHNSTTGQWDVFDAKGNYLRSEKPVRTATTAPMDATPPAGKPNSTGCGQVDPELNKPKILTTPVPEITKPELPGCGGKVPGSDMPTSLPGGNVNDLPEARTDTAHDPMPQSKPEDFILNAKQEQEINEAFVGAIFDTSEAASPNAQANLDKKLRGLEKAQGNAARSEMLPDGRIRYYSKESPSATPGPTRGASYVTEYNPNTGQVRGWYECYDQAGNVNRVHPKSLNGQDLIAQHYPPTRSELELFKKC